MKLKLVLGCALAAVILASCTNLGRNELRSYSPRAKEIRTALNRTVIPDVDLESVKAEDALNVWQEKSREYHPLHFKFQHVVAYPMTFAPGQTPTTTAPISTSKITVRRRKITSKRLLDEICGQANMTWTITGRVITVQPRTTPAVSQP